MKSQSIGAIKKMEKNCGEASRLMKALAHPRRLMLLCHLSVGEKTVSQLEKLCGTSQSTVSQFLGRMKLERLITSDKRGLFVYYSIQDERVKEMITALHHIFCK